ncbi:hypothetical protein COOONC_06464 [Cooperia oncophora]
MSSCSLYAMSLLCIIIGGIRSANFVRRQIVKKRPLEASISMSEAKKFPFTASLVLFTLYVFFKLASRLPEGVHPYLEYIPTITKAHVMKLLLILICYEGCVALAALLKPLFSFVLSLLPIGNRRPRLNIPYFLSIKQGNKEMEEGDIEDAKKSDFQGNKEMEEGDIEDAKKSDFVSYTLYYFGVLTEEDLLLDLLVLC